jgi:rhodanese-related sulfurtransferase
MPEPLEVTPQQVKQRLAGGEKLHLLDVREPSEHQTANIKDTLLIPMRSVPANLQQIEAMSDDAPIVVFCHHGMRSLQVVNWLREQGVENCQSMSGGIDQWSCEIDPSVPRYN